MIIVKKIAIIFVSIKYEHIQSKCDLERIPIQLIGTKRKLQREQIETIIKEQKEYFEKMMAILYFFIFKRTDPETWIPLMMENDPCRNGYTSNTVTEQTNAAYLPIKDMKVVQSIEFCIDHFNKRVKHIRDHSELFSWGCGLLIAY